MTNREKCQGRQFLASNICKRARFPSVTETDTFQTIHIFRFSPVGRGKDVAFSQPTWRENVGQDGTDESVADVHVLFVAIIGTVNFGLLRGTCCAITFYRPRRQSGIVRVLPVASLLLAVVALLFLIVVSGDL